jgi:uncharacterized membrane protein
MYGIFFLLIMAIIILLIIFISKVNQLEQKINRLERQSQEKKTTTWQIPEHPPISSETGPIPIGKVETQSQATIASPKPISVDSKQFYKPKYEPIPPKPSKTREEWESFVGGKLLNRIGALALIIGIGFFLKYAFDKNWISEIIRVGIGFVSGIILIFGGWRFHKKDFRIFAQGLIGAGIAVLYLSVYASFNFYHLLPQIPAFILMSAVTAYTLYLGIRYNSLAVSILGWAGGFLTPILLSTGHANEVGLFTYILLLDIGLLLLLIKKPRWDVLLPLTLGGTYILYFAWFFEYYKERDLILTVLFLSLFWLTFLALELYQIYSLKPKLNNEDSAENSEFKNEMSKIRHITNSFSILIYFISIYSIINTYHHEWMGSIGTLIGLIYFGVFYFSKISSNPVILSEDEGQAEVIGNTRSNNLYKFLQNRFLMTAITLLVIVTFIQFSKHLTVIFLSIEALGLLYTASKFNYKTLLFSGLGVFAIAIFKLLFTYDTYVFHPIEKYWLLINLRTLTFLILCSSIFASNFLLKKIDSLRFRRINILLNSCWSLLLLLLITAEISDSFEYLMINASLERMKILEFNRTLFLSVLWLFYSLPLVWFGLSRKINAIIYVGFGIGALALLIGIFGGYLYIPIEKFIIILNIRFCAFLSLLIILSIYIYIFSNYRESYKWMHFVSNICLISTLALILYLISIEAKDYFDCIISNNNDTSKLKDFQLQNIKQMTLSGIWIIYSIVMMIGGFWRKNRLIRIISMVIFGITILKVFIYDLSFLDTLYRIFSFITLGLILLLASYLYQRFKNVILGIEDKVTSTIN